MELARSYWRPPQAPRTWCAVSPQLLQSDSPRDYLMRWVEVPSLEVSLSEQRYEPLGGGLVRFRAGDFVSDITFDPDGFVANYPGIGARP
jgi:hypothetical protein